MSNMKIVSLLDHEIRTSRDVMVADFEQALLKITNEINSVQRVAQQLRVDVDKLMQQEGTGQRQVLDVP